MKNIMILVLSATRTFQPPEQWLLSRSKPHQMRTSTLILPLAFILALLVAACDNNNCDDGSGGTVTEERELATITGVSTEGSFLVTIEQRAEQRVEIIGFQSHVNNLITDVVDGVCEIRMKDGCYNNLNIEVRIFVPTIDLVQSSGSGNVVMNTFDSLTNMSIEVTGSGGLLQSGILDVSDKITIRTDGSGSSFYTIEAGTAEINTTGSGNVLISGTCDNEVCTISGSGNIEGFDLFSLNCIATSTGSGNMEINVRDTLDATISASGSISYKGNPVITQNITGSGSLINAN